MFTQLHAKRRITLRTWGRVALIVVQLTLVYCLAGAFQPFFYQAF